MQTPACLEPPSGLCVAERGKGLVLLPILSTLTFYLSPPTWQHSTFLQFLPQLSAYLGFVAWIGLNSHTSQKLGLEAGRFAAGAAWGLGVGLVLATINLFTIIKIIPWLGFDITFLKQTPHARLPFWVMVPWFILLIACFVEINFRGFLLGRLLAFGLPAPVAVSGAAILFAYDPFMVTTFKHLHWIAIWDGMVWGAMWLRLRNLYAPIVAHAVEVILVYCVVRAVLS